MGTIELIPTDSQLSLPGFVQLFSLNLFQLCPVGICERSGVVFRPKQSQPLLASLEWGSRTMKDAWRLHKISNTSGCNNSHRQTVYYPLNILIYALQGSN